MSSLDKFEEREKASATEAGSKTEAGSIPEMHKMKSNQNSLQSERFASSAQNQDQNQDQDQEDVSRSLQEKDGQANLGAPPPSANNSTKHAGIKRNTEALGRAYYEVRVYLLEAL